MDGYCQLCERSFVSQRALDQHLRDASVHRFECIRCRRHFKSGKAERQHYRDSPQHHICERCNLDFNHASGLEVHCEEEHNMCSDCGRCFDTPSNLEHHRQVHMVSDVECPGCDRAFISSAAMVLHLEAGTCPSGATCLVVDQAALDADSFGVYSTSEGECARFHCPACYKRFLFMSALLQHDFSGRCPNSEGISVLRSFHLFIQALIRHLNALWHSGTPITPFVFGAPGLADFFIFYRRNTRVDE